MRSQNVRGRVASNRKRTIDLMDLKPYFHGTASRSGAPFCFGSGLPYTPVARKANSFVASSIVSPSLYGHGYHAWRCPGAASGSKNVCISTYRAAASGRARSRRALNLESGPRDSHRPSFDAAVPVDALLERNDPQQSVDVQDHFMF